MKTGENYFGRILVVQNLRIIDANLNRAREAARVIEDHLRFGLSSRKHSLKMKELRHLLGKIQEKYGMQALARRDVDHDPTKFDSLPTLPSRHKDPFYSNSVLERNFKRLQESLRVLEEETRSTPISIQISKARFSSYKLEKEILFQTNKKQKLAGKKLYIILDANLSKNPLEMAGRILSKGVDIIQLRAKSISDRKFFTLASAIKKIVPARTLFIINDRTDIAMAVDADGVHIGESDLHIKTVRRLVPPRFIIGKTTHNLHELKKAIKEKADYISVGPLFPTPLKKNLPANGLVYMKDAVKSGLPFFCIGGITPEKILRASLQRAAICSYVMLSKNPGKAINLIKKALSRVNNQVISGH